MPYLFALLSCLLLSCGTGSTRRSEQSEIHGLEGLELPAAAERALQENGFVVVDSSILTGGEPWKHLHDALRPGDGHRFLTTDVATDIFLFGVNSLMQRVEVGQRALWRRIGARLQELCKLKPRERAAVASVAELICAMSDDGPKPAATVAQLIERLQQQEALVEVSAGVRIKPNGLLALLAEHNRPGLPPYFLRLVLQQCELSTSVPAGRDAWGAWTDCCLDPEVASLLEQVAEPWDTLVGKGVRGTRTTVLVDRENPFVQMWESLAERLPIASGLLMTSMGPLRSGHGIKAAQVEGLPVASKPLDASQTLRDQWFDSLRLLQQVDGRAAPVFHTPTWGLKQVMTQLGAWAAIRHAFRVHDRVSVLLRADAPRVVISPYPEYFRSLAHACDALLAWQDRALSFETDAERVSKVRRSIQFARHARRRTPRPQGLTRTEAWALASEHWIFLQDVLTDSLLDANTPQSELLWAELDFWGKLTAIEQFGSKPKDHERLLMRRILRGPPGLRIEWMGEICRKLADIAESQLREEPLSEEQIQFLKDVPKRLAAARDCDWMHDPTHDNHLIISAVAKTETRVLHVGLGHPAALLLVLPVDGQPTVHVGSVLNYREIVRPETLDARDWRALVRGEQPLPAPKFYGDFWR